MLSKLIPFYVKDLKGLVFYWNSSFPYDKWWREKYNIALFSDEHLNANPLLIKAEYIEDYHYQKELEKRMSENDTKPTKIKTEEVDMAKDFDWDALQKAIDNKE